MELDYRLINTSGTGSDRLLDCDFGRRACSTIHNHNQGQVSGPRSGRDNYIHLVEAHEIRRQPTECHFRVQAFDSD